MPNPLQSLYQGSSTQVLTLSSEDEQLLHQQAIDETGPGTILHDFQAVLDYIGLQGIEVSNKTQFFPLKVLPDINQRFSHPIQIDLQRPQAKSYPHIQAIYLLLRTSGLAYVETRQVKGKKQQLLVLNQTILQSWESLNPTERYFNLLEAWLIWGHAEILGERHEWNDLFTLMMFLTRIPDKGRKVPNYEEQKAFNYIPGLYQLALLELFGLLLVQSGKPEPGKGWRIKSLKRLPWGDVLLLFLFLKTQKDGIPAETEGEEVKVEEPEVEGAFGTWQVAFQPYFPEWQHNLIIPQQEFRNGIYVFKVSLGKIWRCIEIPAKCTLDDLAYAILDSVNFDADHLYLFSYKNRHGWTVEVYHPYSQEYPSTDEFCIGDLSLEEGQSMRFLFDFGDNWKFNVQLEKIEPVNSKIRNPKVLESHGQAPEQYGSWE